MPLGTRVHQTISFRLILACDYLTQGEMETLLTPVELLGVSLEAGWRLDRGVVRRCGVTAPTRYH